MKSSYQVAIIGAGISGLAAAKTLFENGVTDVIVLEAQAKPGGRICSLKVGDCHLELGAQWIHGEKNEVFLISKKNHLLTDEYSSEGEGLYLRENGEVIDEIIVREVDDVVKDILEGCEEYALNGSENNAPQSIGQELLTKFDYYLQNSTTDTETTKEIKRDLLDWHTRFQLIDNACFDLKNLSAKLWGLFKFCGGSEYVNFKNGYSSLIDTLLSGLPENWIMCSTPVQHIDWAEKIKMAKGHDSNTHCNDTESNHMSKIICENGLSLSAQYVIVTCSLGFLKANYKTMFRPLLPNYLSEVRVNK